MDRATQVLERLQGSVVPINVCFNEDGTVAYASVGAYVEDVSGRRNNRARENPPNGNVEVQRRISTKDERNLT